LQDGSAGGRRIGSNRAARGLNLLLPRDPNDDKNIMLEIRAGGGDEASIWAGGSDVLAMPNPKLEGEAGERVAS